MYHQNFVGGAATASGAFCVALWIVSVGLCEDAADLHTAHLRSGNLSLVVADNQAYGKEHRAGYSGISELSLGTEGARNVFVPLYAGLNFEHIFSGDSQTYGWNIFEPRRSPMKLMRVSETRVQLQQSRTANWPLRTRIDYELSEGGINFTFCGVPLEDIWKKHGYIGVFFASYISAPEDMAINFIGRSRFGKGDPQPRWIKHLPEKHGQAANHRPADSDWDPSFDEGFHLELVKGFSNLEYLYPFYYGLSGENVLVLMFKRPGKDAELRFAQSPSGGGQGNPAWDFVYFQRQYVVGREFCFHARVVYKKFQGRQDVVRLYEAWSNEKVVRPNSDPNQRRGN
ncbi:MAG: hypothetical protein HY298_21085 [Verrucomicrobia bacterium]|nr:hypothetical protein [Verrucomicrobiota bacterium]